MQSDPDAAAAPSATSTVERPGTAVSLLVGAIAGGASGLFGVGGGIVIVPCLVYLARLDQRRAQALSLVAIVPIAVSGTVGYAIDAQVNWSVAALVASGGVLGAVLGTELLHRAPIRVLQLCFAGASVVAAIELFLNPPTATGPHDLTVGLGAAYVVVGLLAGVSSGLLGVGGGIVVVPILTLLFGFPAVLAKGTSLACMVPTSVIGGARNLRSGHAELGPALLVGSAGVLTALGASRVSLGLDATVASGLFATLLLVVAATTARRAVRNRSAATR